MPYLNLLVENLHTYVDDFLQYAIQSLAKSHSLESMCLELFAQECEFMEQFQRGKEKVMHVYKEDLVKYKDDIIWLPEDPAELLSC